MFAYETAYWTWDNLMSSCSCFICKIWRIWQIQSHGSAQFFLAFLQRQQVWEKHENFDLPKKIVQIDDVLIGSYIYFPIIQISFSFQEQNQKDIRFF